MVNDTFEKLKNSVNRGLTTFSIRTSSTIEKSKLRMHIESLEKETNALLLQVGETAYISWMTDEDKSDVIGELFKTVREKKDEIESLTEELNGIDARDYQIIGVKKESGPTVDAEEPPRSYVCPGCGAAFASPIKFCRKCGTKMGENREQE